MSSRALSRGLFLAALGFVLVAASQVARADPEGWRREGWTKTDFSKTRIGWNEILSGGPPKDGIPSIDRPVFKMVPEIKSLTGKEAVISLAIGGDARAYPLRILIWHEIGGHSATGTT